MAKINGQEFIREVAEHAGLSIKDTRAFYDAYHEVAFDHVKAGDEILLSKWGKYYPLEQKERKVVLNGQERKVPKHTVMKFSASKTLNDKINE